MDINVWLSGEEHLEMDKSVQQLKLKQYVLVWRKRLLEALTKNRHEDKMFSFHDFTSTDTTRQSLF